MLQALALGTDASTAHWRSRRPGQDRMRGVRTELESSYCVLRQHTGSVVGKKQPMSHATHSHMQQRFLLLRSALQLGLLATALG